MTNEEKYKTPEERLKQFRKYCADTECANCKMRPSGVRMPFVDNCTLHWLSLEAKEEKLLSRPFCGGDAEVVRSKPTNGVIARCTECYSKSMVFDTRGEAVVAWNRRAK